jgi:hypothetical protein
MTPVPDFIRYGHDDEPTAEPAFRTLLYLRGTMNDPAVHEGLTALFETFLNTYRKQLWGLVVRDVGIKRTRRSINTASITLARDWLNSTSKVVASSLRLNGAPDDIVNAPRIPHLRFEEGRGMAFIELAGPPKALDARNFADEITPIVAALPLFCGLMGFGFHMPASLDSRGFILPATTARYATAIEILLRDPSIGLTRDGSAFRFDRHPSVSPGIADIGWRTFVGPSFLDRLPNLDLVHNQSGVIVDRGPAGAILTAGSFPIWGDVEGGEDISAYRTVAKALAPVCMAREIMVKGYFNGPEGNPEAEKRLDAYRARFQPTIVDP